MFKWDERVRNYMVSEVLGKEEGLNYVYIGNVPGHPYENTYCPRCGALLIKRYSFDVVSYHITAENKCPECGQCIPICSKFGGIKIPQDNIVE